jgi:hypothetical protein
MFQVPTLLVDSPLVFPFEKTAAEQFSSPSTNVWLFTDPLAKAIYSQRGELGALEQDICTFVMFQGKWSPDELELKQQIDDLYDARVISPKIGFGNISPHPTIYKVLAPGKIEIHGEKYHFKIGEEIVFASWAERLSHPGVHGPLRIGRFDISDSVSLCCQAYPQLTGLPSNELGGLHQIACYPKHRGG